MVSFNHYAPGAVGDFLYRRIAGIESASGGYRSFRIAPLMGGGIRWAKASVDTPFGVISSAWELAGNSFRIAVEVPVSCTCSLTLPNGETHALQSGPHQFTCSI